MYKRTYWKDHVEGVQEGTDMNAANFNNIEVGVMESSALAAMNAEHQRYCTDQAKNNEIVKISTKLTGPNTVHEVAIPSKFTRNTSDYTIIPMLHLPMDTNTAGDIWIVGKYAEYFAVEYNGTASEIDVEFHIVGGMI